MSCNRCRDTGMTHAAENINGHVYRYAWRCDCPIGNKKYPTVDTQRNLTIDEKKIIKTFIVPEQCKAQA